MRTFKKVPSVDMARFNVCLYVSQQMDESERLDKDEDAACTVGSLINILDVCDAF